MKVFVRTAFFACLVLSMTLALAPAAAAQAVNVTTGAVNGRVVDQTGAVLPGATVTATNLDTGLERHVVSDADGTYVIGLLPPGHYRVDAVLSGLGKATSGSVDVLLGNATKVDLTIAAQVTEAVTVRAAAPIVDTTRTGTATSVTTDQIENLPLLGRDFRALAALSPGVTDAFGGRITADGARGLSTDYNIDGATSNNNFFGENTGGTRAPFTFSQAAIKEFQVVLSQYNAEYGQGIGAQLNAITKSGTNELHGEGFYFRRNRSWAATRPLTLSNGQVVTDSFRAKDSTQPGFAFGGPIKRNKLFYFVNFDGQRQKLPIAITGTSDVRGNAKFTALPAATQQAFFNKLEGIIGHPYDDELGYDQTFNQNTYLGKVDANLNADNHVSVRDNYTDFTNGNNQSLGNFSNQGTEHDKFNQLVGQSESVINNRTVNQLLVQYSRDERPITPVSSGPETQIRGITTGTLFFGQNDFLPNNTIEKKTQIKDTVHRVMGTHTVSVGAELLFMHIDNLFPRNANGIYLYSTPTDFVNGVPNSFSMGYGPGGGLTSWTQNTYAMYASDNFKVAGRLTLDLGVRYDWQTMPKPATNAFPQHPEFITNIKEDKNNVAPRVGFAYDLSGDGRSVLRGGVGKFFGYMPDILLSNPLTQISGNFNQVTVTCSKPTNGVPCPTYPNVLTADQFSTLAKVATDIVTISPTYQAQQAWRGSVQFEQQIGRSYSVSVGGVFSRLSNVEGSQNINAVPNGILLGDLPVYELRNPNRLYPDLGVVRQLCSCETASFKSLILETHRLALDRSRLSWDLSYTWSKSTDEDTNERSTSTSFLFDPFNPALSRGPSDNDVRHRIGGGVTYRLPYGFLAAVIASWRTGVPYTGGISFTGSNISGNPNSLNGLSQMSGNIPIFVDASGKVIDLTAASNFTQAQLSTFLQGAQMVGRNTFRQPHWHDVDIRISKTFDLNTRVRVQLIAEAFNLLNTQNKLVSSNNQNLFTATYDGAKDQYTFAKVNTFGFVNSYSATPDPRQYQVAAKFIF